MRSFSTAAQNLFISQFYRALMSSSRGSSNQLDACAALKEIDTEVADVVNAMVEHTNQDFKTHNYVRTFNKTHNPVFTKLQNKMNDFGIKQVEKAGMDYLDAKMAFMRHNPEWLRDFVAIDFFGQKTGGKLDAVLLVEEILNRFREILMGCIQEVGGHIYDQVWECVDPFVEVLGPTDGGAPDEFDKEKEKVIGMLTDCVSVAQRCGAEHVGDHQIDKVGWDCRCSIDKRRFQSPTSFPYFILGHYIRKLDDRLKADCFKAFNAAMPPKTDAEKFADKIHQSFEKVEQKIDGWVESLKSVCSAVKTTSRMTMLAEFCLEAATM